MNAPGPLGWIRPQDRTQAQNDAHERALAKRPKFALPFQELPKGTKIVLTKLWSDADCVSDMGREFKGFRQLTGSCVGVSEGNGICTLSCVQRKLTSGATKAFIPWWPFPYGRTRDNEGDQGQGEGAVDSVMGDTLIKEGVFAYDQPGLPQFDDSDGLALTSQQELLWSDGSRIDQKWRTLAKQYPLGSDTTLNSSDQIITAVSNGAPVLDGCDNYIGNGSIKGNGTDAYAVGRYDGQGGHSTCILGVWNHPNDGYLFLYSNQWRADTYPVDPAGGGRCCVWMPLSEMDKLFRNGGSGGETMALSHLTYLPAQPAVLSWILW